jgi:hypothetical protein
VSLPGCQECGGRAEVICPGDVEVRSELGILLRAPRPDRVYCLAHARAAGWPWLRGEAPARATRPPRHPRRRRGEPFPREQVLAGAP